jgi:hypothetical protein
MSHSNFIYSMLVYRASLSCNRGSTLFDVRELKDHWQGWKCENNQGEPFIVKPVGYCIKWPVLIRLDKKIICMNAHTIWPQFVHGLHVKVCEYQIILSQQCVAMHKKNRLHSFCFRPKKINQLFTNVLMLGIHKTDS